MGGGILEKKNSFNRKIVFIIKTEISRKHEEWLSIMYREPHDFPLLFWPGKDR